ncbi:MAG: HD domain-containing protein [Candidatus Aenigmarchaeota archaeon]|nr:HD domain-containing protein [Candidatus Aenigmarchaeota archaeon]
MEVLENLEQEIKSLFSSESSGHDFEHLKRVLNIALHIQKIEGGDNIVVAAAALLHDIHRLIQQETGNYCSPKDSIPSAKKILDKTNLPREKVDKILQCVEHHEEYGFSANGKKSRDIETQILQDVDRLDVIGAIGIGRTFAYGGAYNISMWVPEIPLEGKKYEHEKHDPSTIHHFYNKLLKLNKDMNIETAKKMANKRHKFLENFLKEFFAEWKGEK